VFPTRYFGDRYFAPRYFLKVGATAAAPTGQSPSSSRYRMGYQVRDVIGLLLMFLWR
jgi:hypothetical protein